MLCVAVHPKFSHNPILQSNTHRLRCIDLEYKLFALDIVYLKMLRITYTEKYVKLRINKTQYMHNYFLHLNCSNKMIS